MRLVPVVTAAAAALSLVGLHAPGPPAAPSRPDTPAPELANDSWLNADHPLRLAQLRGRVVLLNFWVFTCGNCTRTVPSLVDFDERYRDRGLTIIGIHTPEFPPYSGEHDKEKVRRALRAYGINYPVAQDNDRRTWDAYDIHYWPSFVLIDRRGRIRETGYGEFHERDATYKEWSRKIETLLAEPSPAPALELKAARDRAGMRLTLLAPPGARINARARPALELKDGTVLRFSAPHLTPDSAYFAEPPTARAPVGASLKGATLRASVCPAGERVCRIIEMAVDM